MADEQYLHPGCNCSSHQEIYRNWRRENALLRISSCMRTCPYCGNLFSNASRLRKHLRQEKYRRRNILIEPQRAGASGIGSPLCLPLSSDFLGAAKTPIPGPPANPTSCSPLSHIRPTLISQARLESMLGGILHEFGFSSGIRFLSSPCTLEAMTEKTRSLWHSSTSSIPRLFDSTQGWRGRAPLTRELIMETIQKIQVNLDTRRTHTSETQFQVNYQGEVDKSVDPFIVVSQLVDPDLSKPAFLTGLRLPIVDDLGLRVPYSVCDVFEPFHETNNQVNLTPRYSFVDLHIDYGADGLSIPIGDCRKVWLLYPPTTHNLMAIKVVDGQRGRLARLAQQLEGCVVVETDSSHAIHIPAASIHATFTLQGGFLVAKDFTTSMSLMAIAELLVSGLDESLPSEARLVCLEWFERSLDISLTHSKALEAVCAWLRAEAKLAIWASAQRAWRVSVRRLWEQALVRDLITACPCGKQEPGSSFAIHFPSAHLSFLFSPTQIRRHCRVLNID